PRGPARVGLAIEARLLDHDAELFACLDHPRARGAVAPAHPVSASFFHQIQREEVQPVRLRRAKARPFVGRFLPPAVQLQMLAVDVEPGLGVEANAVNAEWNLAPIDVLAT